MTEFTGRTLTPITIKKVEHTKDGSGVTVTTTENTGFFLAMQPGVERIVDGDEMVLETRNFSLITGLKFAGEDWIFHKSDDQLDEEHAAWQADWERRKEEQLEEHRGEWKRREAALPSAYRRRLAKFRNNSPSFDREGWGYELIICELAVLYQQSAGKDSDAVNRFAEENGTSGNQHEVAKALARVQQTVAPEDFPAGMAPLIGSADYSGLERDEVKG